MTNARIIGKEIAMTGEDGTRNGWRDYRPSKVLWFWSCVGVAVLTMIVGFTWGGWVTGSTAAYKAAEARETGRAELAATICVERFMQAPDAGVQLAALKDESSWGRDDLIADAGWTTPLGLDEPIDGAADLCADRLAAMELPETAVVEEAVIEAN
jgi:hypothetical protein